MAFASHSHSTVQYCLHDKLGGDFSKPEAVSQLCEIRAGKTERDASSVVARTCLKAGTSVFRVHGELINHPTCYSIQFNAKYHAVVPGFKPFESLRHSCNPSCRFVVDPDCPIIELVTLRGVREGEALTVNFNATEWDISEKFVCHCDEVNCVGVVGGFLYLSCSQRRDLRPLLTSYLTKKAEMLVDVDLVEDKDKMWCPTLGPRCFVYVTPYYGKTVVAAEAIAKGTKLYECAGEVFDHPTMYTVQLDETRHINCTQGTCEYTAHSCDPTAFFQVENDTLILTAARDIGQGEQITFNYCTNEWNMATPFHCLCGNRGCFGYIAGFANVPEDRRAELVHLLSPAIRNHALRDGLITPEQVAQLTA